MFVAASTRCFSDLPFAEACQQLVDLEYDRIEIWMDNESAHLRTADVVANPERFVTQYREATRLTPIALSLKADVTPAEFGELCRVAKLLKVTQITLPAGPLGNPYNEEVDRLRSQVAISSANGIRLSIKTEIGRLSEDPRTAVELCQSIPGLGVTMDPSHLLCGPHGNQSIDPVFPYVYHTQLRDSLPKQLQVRVGLGEIDYNRIISQLRRYDYQRALSVEILPELLGDCERALELRKIRMLLDSLL